MTGDGDARGCAWVLLVGGLTGVLAAADADGSVLWWILRGGAAWVWGLPYVAAALSIVGGVAVLVLLVRRAFQGRQR